MYCEAYSILFGLYCPSTVSACTVDPGKYHSPGITADGLHIIILHSHIPIPTTHIKYISTVIP